MAGHAQMGTVVVLTALNLEYAAVRAHLAGLRRVTHRAGTGFEIGHLADVPVRVVIARTGEGNTAAAVVANRAIDAFDPRMVLFVGIAGALKDDLALGDVVVATRVYASHGGKEESGGFLARPRAFEAPHELLDLAQHLDVTRSWPSAPGFAVHFKPIAASEVVLNSRRTPLARQLRAHYNDAVAIEMESAGAAQAAHASHALPTLTIRGISDKADGHKHAADTDGSQERAAANAAAIAFTLVRAWSQSVADPINTKPDPESGPTPALRSTALDDAPTTDPRSPSAAPSDRDTNTAEPQTLGPTGALVRAGQIDSDRAQGAFGTRPLPPRQLPPAMRDFTGRVIDLAALDALLPTDPEDTAPSGHPGAVVISAIGGSAGIGKSTLAVYWAHRVREWFPGGTLYANLRGYGPGEPATAGEILEQFLRAVGMAPGRIPGTLEEQTSAYRSLLDRQRMLIVLDNANSAEQVRPLLPASAGCFVVVTSRSSLTGLVVSHGAARINLDLLPLDEAVEMLARIVGHARARQEPDALTAIAHACARLPLALRIAGQRAASHPHLALADVHAELADEHGRLEALSRSDDEASTVRAVFTWSYNVLDGERALVFRRLGLHPGTEVGVHAAAALADIPPHRARRALEALAEVHLVEPVAVDRYRTHDLLRVYALERAESEETSERRRDATRELLEFYAHTVDSVDRRVILRRRPKDSTPRPPRHPLVFNSDRHAFQWFLTERANIVAAAHHAAATRQHALAWQIAAAVTGLFDRDGNRSDWIRTLRIGLASARALGDQRREALMLQYLGYVLTQTREFDEAIDSQNRALRIYRTIANQAELAGILDDLGLTYHGAGQLDNAVDCYTQSLSLSQQLPDTWYEAIVLNHLGDLYADLNRFDEAIDHHQRALDAFRAAHDLSREGWTLRLLGDAYREHNNLEQSIAAYRQALVALDERGYTPELARCLAGLAESLHRTGQIAEAQHSWREALTRFEQIGDPQADDIRGHLSA